MQVIIDALKEGSITAYDASLPTDEFTAPLTFQELMNTLERADTMSSKPMDKYDEFFSMTYLQGAMDVKTKHLVALGASLCAGCQP